MMSGTCFKIAEQQKKGMCGEKQLTRKEKGEDC